MAFDLRATDRFPYISRPLTTTGQLGGTAQAAVDGSVTPVLFKISPDDVETQFLTRLIVKIRDSGTFRAETYGAELALTNGITVGRFDDTTGELVDDFTGGLKINTNAEWGGFCYDVSLKTWGPGDAFLLVRWTFTTGGVYIVQRPGGPTALGVLISDNLTTLVSQEFIVQGHRTKQAGTVT